MTAPGSFVWHLVYFSSRFLVWHPLLGADGNRTFFLLSNFLLLLSAPGSGFCSVKGYHRTTTPPHHRTAVPPYRRTTAPPYHRTAAPPHHRTTVPPYRRTTATPSYRRTAVPSHRRTALPAPSLPSSRVLPLNHREPGRKTSALFRLSRFFVARGCGKTLFVVQE